MKQVEQSTSGQKSHEFSIIEPQFSYPARLTASAVYKRRTVPSRVT
jgi:hypothetical protein